jgi:hypothetical protein
MLVIIKIWIITNIYIIRIHIIKTPYLKGQSHEIRHGEKMMDKT